MRRVLDPIESVISSPEFSCGWKLDEGQQAIFWKLCQQSPDSPSKALLESAEARQYQIDITPRHANRLRKQWGLSRHRGRPSHNDCVQTEKQQGELVKFNPNLSNVGLQLFHIWMEQWSTFTELTEALQQAIKKYKEENPKETFDLLSHYPETLLRRFQALFYAPLFGIEKLTQYDVKEHSLPDLLGRNYQSSTLNQFLGHLERIDAAESLMPLLSWGETGELAYIDGHMIALWTSQKMHKGKITMLGRIMAGSQAIIAHDEQGQALYFEYHSPDYRLPSVILDYCQKLVERNSIQIFVIDREINSVQMAREFETRGWGLISMLDKNEYDGFVSFDIEELKGGKTQEERIYQAFWKDEAKRKEDPRHFVLVEQEEKILAYWGTSHVVEVLEKQEWPQVYRQRNELQENAFKRMIAHGALNTNYGFKKIWGPDRHQQRARKRLKERLQKVTKKLTQRSSEVLQQKEKVQESQQRKHGKRLQQREQKLVELEQEENLMRAKQEHLNTQLSKIGDPKQRADRDFRKQKIMTFRTLLLENYLWAFMEVLLAPLGITLSTEIIIDLLFKRSGRYIQTKESCIFWMNKEGLSAPYQKQLDSLIESLNQMKLIHQGKAVQIRSRDGPNGI